MGLLAAGVERVLRNLIPVEGHPAVMVETSRGAGHAQLPDAKYRTYAMEGYSKNELVYAAIEELATSAAEPRWKARVGGQWVFDHPVLALLNRPNPFMHRFEFWATVMMYRALAGNAYALIVQTGSGRPVEMWLLRPDRVKVVPHATQWISHYEYDVGLGEPVRIPPEDVIHWKTRNPLNDWYGMPPLMAAAGRVDIDNFMKDFVKAFFTNAGVPGGVLAVESVMTPEMKTEIRERYNQDYGGPKGWHNLLVLDNTKASFTPMTSALGNGGLVVPELDEIAESRILMVFQVPPEIIGARVGMQGSSYDARRAARETFWDETLTPIYADLAGSMNLRLVPNFPRLEEVAADLSEVRALLEDMDKLHARVRSDMNQGLMTIEEGRALVGYGDIPDEGTFLIPSSLAPVAADKVKDNTVDISETVRGAGPVSGVESGEDTAVQAKALNGAQISSLLVVVQEVAGGRLSKTAGQAMLQIAFPSLSRDLIGELLDAAEESVGAGDSPPADNDRVAQAMANLLNGRHA